MFRRYFIVLQYNGKNYHGWQIQPNGPTVQAELNGKLSILLKEKIETIGAGRTDTGVHAKYFVAHFDCKQDINKFLENLTFKLNGFLPGDIRIIKIIPVNQNAHARFDAISRSYQYFISTVKSVFSADYSWQLSADIDVDLMNMGAELLMDYKDFSSFSKTGTTVKTNLCSVTAALWHKEDDMLIFTITSDRFLRNMVRAIVGTMVDLGKKKIDIMKFRQIIEAGDRSMAGESAPAQGLFLWNIKYPYDL